MKQQLYSNVYIYSGISFVLSSLLFNVVPTVLEIGLVCTILGSRFGSSFVGVTLGALTLYTVFTFAITNWRTRFRKEMNQLDNEAATVIIDSLLNYETVKVSSILFMITHIILLY